MITADKLEVLYDGIRVGTMASYQRYRTAFEYSAEWLRDGFSISPFSLPLEPGVKIAGAVPFDGLFGIFADSLPDGWGRLLVDRMLRKNGEDPAVTGPLARLSIVGESGMGALEYRPVFDMQKQKQTGDLDWLAGECARVLRSEKTEDLDTLFALGGSSGGARPKILTEIEGEEWIIKFPSSGDPEDIGLMEYEYTECARECGIEVPESRLFPSEKCAGYYGCRRFDRYSDGVKINKLHMASASALLEVSHRAPSLDYDSLMALTWQLTRQAGEMEKMYTLMCFNVYAHNRDDHSNNFSYLCDGRSWRLAPAYDLTYSDSIGGEHATTVAGEGKDPTLNDMLAVGRKAGLKEKRAKEIACEVRERVEKKLSKYLKG